MKGTVELTQKFLGLPFFFNKYNSYDCTSYEKKKEKERETVNYGVRNLPLEHTQALSSLPTTDTALRGTISERGAKA